MFMNRLQPRHTSFLALAGCWLALNAAPHSRAYAADPGDQLPPNITEQLKKNATAMSAVHLEFTESQSGSEVPDQYGGPAKYSASFDGGRFYLHSEIPERRRGKLRTVLSEDSFDGKIYYDGTLGDKSSAGTAAADGVDRYAVEDRTAPRRDAARINMPYLAAAGYHFASSIADLENPFIKSLILHYLNSGAEARVGQEKDLMRVTVTVPDPILEAVRRIDLAEYRKQWQTGRNTPEQISQEMEAVTKMQQMEPKRTVSFLLDPKYGYGVVERVDSTLAGRRLVRVVADGWKYYEDVRIWLPGRCTENYYSMPTSLAKISDHPIEIHTLQLDRVEFGPQKNVKFALDYSTPGSIIRDLTSEEAKKSPRHVATYVVSANGNELRRSAEEARGEVKRDRGSWLIILNLGLIAVIAMVVLFRSRVKRRIT